MLGDVFRLLMLLKWEFGVVRSTLCSGLGYYLIGIVSGFYDWGVIMSILDLVRMRYSCRAFANELVTDDELVEFVTNL